MSLLSGIDWSQVTGTILSTVIVVAVVGFLAREAFKTSVGHVLNRHLEAHKADLDQKLEEFKVGLATSRDVAKEKRAAASELIKLLSNAGRRAKDLCEIEKLSQGSPPEEPQLKAMNDAVDALEACLYATRLTVMEASEELYRSIHTFKNELIAVRQMATNMKRWQDKGETERSSEIGSTLAADAADIQKRCQQLIESLADFADQDLTR